MSSLIRGGVGSAGAFGAKTRCTFLGRSTMPRKGEMVEIPTIGRGFRVLWSDRETGDELLPFEYRAPRRRSVPEYVHPSERRAGRWFPGRRVSERETGNGSWPPVGARSARRRPHARRNLGDGEVGFLVEFRPALNPARTERGEKEISSGPREAETVKSGVCAKKSTRGGYRRATDSKASDERTC